MTLNDYLKKLQSTPELLEFTELMEMLESHYNFTPTAFKNGQVSNSETENLGSCKVFSFGKQQGLTAEQTLACFGSFYREDVLQNPEGNDHQNIRQFMQTGWEGVQFSGNALRLK